MNYLLPERLDRLAREYALGTLAGPARRRFERVLHHSRAAAMAVDVWRERLAVLELAAPPIQPPASNWRGIEQRVFGDATQPARATGAPTASSPAPTLWQTVRAWMTGRTLAGALSGILLCTVVMRWQPALFGVEPLVETVSPSYVGLIADANGKPVLVLSSRRHGRKLTMKLLQPLAVPAGQVAQLWALPKDGAAPFPIGVLPSAGSAQSTLPETSEKLFANVSQVAISFSATAAKPGDKAPDAFVLKGQCVKVW
jgi:anti-sigma-K factor RskA